MKALAAGVSKPDTIDTLKAQIVAPAVVAAIRGYDPALSVWWDRAACRWSLMRKSRGRWHLVGILQNEDRSYRPLDMRLLEEIRKGDTWRNAIRNDRTPGDQFADASEQADADREVKAIADFNDDISHATRENRRTLRRVAALAGQLGKAF